MTENLLVIKFTYFLYEGVHTFLSTKRLPPQCREDTVGPVISRDIQSSKHLRCSNGFGVHSHFSVWCPTICHCFHQHVDAISFTRTTGSEYHHSMTHSLSLK